MAYILYLWLSIYVHTVNLAVDGRSSELRNALGGHNRVNLEVYLEIVLAAVLRLAALGDGNRANIEMHSEAMIERTWKRSIWRRSIWRQSIGREARRELRLYAWVNS